MRSIASLPASVRCAVVLLALWAATARSAPPDDTVERGRRVFNEECRDCHAFDRRKTGPPLGGVTTRRDAAWLKAWIADPVTMAASDPTGKELKGVYQTQMPKIGLSAAQIDAVIRYLATQPAQ